MGAQEDAASHRLVQLLSKWAKKRYSAEVRIVTTDLSICILPYLIEKTIKYQNENFSPRYTACTLTFVDGRIIITTGMTTHASICLSKPTFFDEVEDTVDRVALLPEDILNKIYVSCNGQSLSSVGGYFNLVLTRL
jgi:hypothetical protein